MVTVPRWQGQGGGNAHMKDNTTNYYAYNGKLHPIANKLSGRFTDEEVLKNMNGVIGAIKCVVGEREMATPFTPASGG